MRSRRYNLSTGIEESTMKNTSLFRTIIAFLTVVFVTSCAQVINDFTIQPPAQPGMELFVDDFDPPSKGWGTMSQEEGVVGFGYGGMVFAIEHPETILWSVNGKQLTNSRIDVDAILVDGSADDFFGVVCRYQDDDNFYGFLVSHDGYFGILKYQDGEMEIMMEDGNLSFSEAINRGAAFNRIQVLCNGEVLSLSVNDTQLVEIEDGSFSSGKIGLMAGTNENEGVMVLFDNLVVYQP